MQQTCQLGQLIQAKFTKTEFIKKLYSFVILFNSHMCSTGTLETFYVVNFLLNCTHTGPRRNSAWLPKQQLWATLIICLWFADYEWNVF